MKTPTEPSTKHTHVFDTFKSINVIADNPKYDMSKHGVWALVVKVCKCGREVGIDFGSRPAMAQKLQSLIDAQTTVRTPDLAEASTKV